MINMIRFLKKSIRQGRTSAMLNLPAGRQVRNDSRVILNSVQDDHQAYTVSDVS